SLRIVRDGEPQPGRQRREGADDEVGRQAEDAGQDEAMPLVGRRRMAGIVLDRAVVEAEQIAANRVRLPERVVDAESPVTVERALRGQVERVEPVLLRIARDKDVAETGDAEAAGAVGAAVAEEEGHPVTGANPGVVRREQDPADAGSEADVELIAERRPGVVVDEEHFGIGRDAAGNQAVEAGLAQVRGLPDDRRLAVARRAVERELERADAPLQPELLVEAGVVEDAVVVASVSAEGDMPSLARQIVGETDARLPGRIKRRTVAAVGEIAARVDERRRGGADVV